ncbi:Acetolactate synthase isozyme 1 large subunit [Morganella morganii]|nr:Acetolactate synthase isozyme 1 large subunit [Morganella morganii]
MYIGGGIVASQSQQLVQSFAERAGLPTTMTLMGLGTIPQQHPLYLGMLGMHGARYTNMILQESDLLIVVGARFDDRAIGKAEQFCPDAKIIHVDIDRAEISKIKQPDIAINADAGQVLAMLLPQIEGECPSGVE